MKIFNQIKPEEKIAIDTNILIYLFTRQDLKKKEIVKQIWSYFSFKCIPYQVLKELTKVLYKKFGLTFKEIKILFELLYDEIYEIILPNENTIFLYYKIMEKYNFSFWDGYIIAKCLQSECKYLLSEDLHNNLIVDGKLKIINPFIWHSCQIKTNIKI